jgi:DNA (cytosine-5)-methyltransferase 1
VFVVGCLGDWRSAAKVLFEPESLCRDITPSRGKRKEIANCLTKSPSSYSSYNPARSEGNAVICADVAPTITSSGAGWSRPGNAATEPDTYVAYNITFCDANGTRKDRPNGGLYVNETDTSNTLTRAGVGTFACDTYNGTIQGDVTATITTTGGGVASGPSVMQNMKVRRLTPMECERLQGFPDNYTNTPTSSDATRYKALGNSMAVPVMKWIGERINEMEKMG